MKPFFPYYGAKWRLASQYPAPEGSVGEPFAGSAAYSVRHAVEEAHLVDMDPVVCAVWRYLIKATPEDIYSLPLLEVGESILEYDLPKGAQYLVGYWLSKGVSKPTMTRTQNSVKNATSLYWGERVMDRLAAQVPLIKGWTIKRGDFSQLRPTDTTFIDPPYTVGGAGYAVPFDEYERLAAFSRRRRGLTIVCEGPDADWLPFEHLGGFKTQRSGRSQEYVWINRRKKLT